MQTVDKLALTLVLLGGVNWGCVGLFRFDLVAFLCGGSGSLIGRVVYGLVGLAALWCIPMMIERKSS